MAAAFCPPGAVGLRAVAQGCYLRYEIYDFLSDGADVTFVTGNCSSSSGSGSRPGPYYAANLAAALDLNAQMAPSRPDGQYFSAARQGSGTNAAYALAQCLAYLSPSQCAACLSHAACNVSAACKDSPSGYVYLVTCYYVYGNAPLLFNTATAPSPSPTSIATSAIRAPAPVPSRVSAHSDATSQKKRTSSFKIPVVVAVACVVLVLAAAILVCGIGSRRQRPRKGSQAGGFNNTRDESLQLSLCNHFRPKARKFTVHELRQATSDFDPRYKLGEGGFGPVYKGCLISGREVAVKMLSSESHQGASEFSSEVNLITTIQHRNLIQLLGYCDEGSQRLLVYEYLPNRSLDMLLFGGSDTSPTVEWKTRFDIIVGIAQGLSYLHEDCLFKIVHRDIKASNILLDNNFGPKIADFGLARLFPDDVTHVTTRVAGTLGYLAPEYALNGRLTEKTDVYSFGALVLEIVSGRRIKDQTLPPEQEHLLEWAWALFERNQQIELLDRKLGRTSEDADEVNRVVHVALLCTQTSPIARPSYPPCCSASLLFLTCLPSLAFINFLANSARPIS